MTTLAVTLSNRYLTRTANWLRDLFLITMGSLCAAVLAQIRIPLPFTPVPITGQTFGVLLIGAMLGSKRGTASMTLYLLSGGLGLPFFTGGQSGWSYLAGPTLGYLLGFILAAYITGRLSERGLERGIRTSLLPFLAGTLIIYLCGAGWLALSLGMGKAILLGILPFLIGDAIKMALAAVILPTAWKWVR